MILRTLVLLCLLSSVARADDWPDFLGPKRRGVSQETGWNMDWNAKEPRVLWKAQVGAGVSSCAVVSRTN